MLIKKIQVALPLRDDIVFGQLEYDSGDSDSEGGVKCSYGLEFQNITYQFTTGYLKPPCFHWYDFFIRKNIEYNRKNVEYNIYECTETIDVGQYPYGRLKILHAQMEIREIFVYFDENDVNYDHVIDFLYGYGMSTPMLKRFPEYTSYSVSKECPITFFTESNA